MSHPGAKKNSRTCDTETELSSSRSPHSYLDNTRNGELALFLVTPVPIREQLALACNNAAISRQFMRPTECHPRSASMTRFLGVITEETHFFGSHVFTLQNGNDDDCAQCYSIHRICLHGNTLEKHWQPHLLNDSQT
ncbi:hypothetical protein CEXT_541861 [Caerostris extrusa]|uniref:Uncharacterized protein n=1 Tax=Caerostris extrusa TaxID=172846 RepID=A0AAV4U1X7_CAEEX|nr:hypothetical protein CEXT_541861 [Caerostris extrusa]